MDHPEVPQPNLEPVPAQAQQQARLAEDALDPSSCWRDLHRIVELSPGAKRKILNKHLPGDWTRDFYRNRANEKQVEAWLRKNGYSGTVLIVGRSKQGKSTLINCFFTAKDSGRPYHKEAPVGNIKSKAMTRGRAHYTLRFKNSELELVDTRGFTLPEHWRSELLRLVRGQSLPKRKGDERVWSETRNLLQESIKPRRARVVLLVLRGDKAKLEDFDEYRQMGQALDGVVPYLFVITYDRLPVDLNIAKLAKKLGAKVKEMVFPIELYSSDDPRPNEERNGRLLSLLLHVIAEAETQGVGLYDAVSTRFAIVVRLAVAVLLVSLFVLRCVM